MNKTKKLNLIFYSVLTVFAVLALAILITLIYKGILSYFGIVDGRRQWFLLGMLIFTGLVPLLLILGRRR